MTVIGDRVAFFPAERAFSAQREEILAAVEEVLSSGRLVLGPQVDAFERELAESTACAAAVGVASGTDAVELVLRALDLPPASEVLCPNLTAVATATAIVRAGLRPVLVDVDERTLTLAPEAAAAAVGTKTAAIVAVHLYGRAAPVRELLALALPVVEDAAQAHALDLGGAPAGSVGVAGCFSFYPTKNLGAFGDGGAVVSRDPDVVERVRTLRTYGQKPMHFALEAGLNSRLDELQAALLRVRLRRLGDDNARRTAIAAAYDAALGTTAPHGVHHLYVIRAVHRDVVRAELARRGIETGVHYPWPLSAMPAFAEARRGGVLAVSERAAAEVISLPCHAHLRDDEIERVTAALAAVAAAVHG